MKQKTNENKLISSGYQELNPEMDAFLVGYLEDGRHMKMGGTEVCGKAPSISMTRSAITFYPP